MHVGHGDGVGHPATCTFGVRLPAQEEAEFDRQKLPGHDHYRQGGFVVVNLDVTVLDQFVVEHHPVGGMLDHVGESRQRAGGALVCRGGEAKRRGNTVVVLVVGAVSELNDGDSLTAVSAFFFDCERTVSGDIVPIVQTAEVLVDEVMERPQDILPRATVPYYAEFSTFHAVNTCLYLVAVARSVVSDQCWTPVGNASLRRKFPMLYASAKLIASARAGLARDSSGNWATPDGAFFGQGEADALHGAPQKRQLPVAPGTRERRSSASEPKTAPARMHQAAR